MHHYVIDPAARRNLQRGADELVAGGPATTIEVLVEISRRIGGLAAIVAVLSEVEARPKPTGRLIAPR